MTSLIYNPETNTLLEQTAANLAHALLLEGPDGVGLLTTAKEIAGKNLASLVEPTDKMGQTDKQKGSIKISQVRALYDATKGKSNSDRLYIIDDADKMTLPAQNAFLKLLEEPVKGVHFILTAHNYHKLLPTVLSRVTRVRLKQISTEQSLVLISSFGVTDERKVQQLLFMADGRPAEITRLITDPAIFDKSAAYITDARTFLSGTAYDKLAVLNQYQGDRTGALQLLDFAGSILLRSITAKPDSELIILADRLRDVYERITANGNIRLQLLTLVV